MRRALLLLALLATHAGASQDADGPVGPLQFRTDVQPIFERRCQPCHFPGGTMHAKLPFDEQRIILTLGTKVLTRIKNEQERATIQRFLDERKALNTSTTTEHTSATWSRRDAPRADSRRAPAAGRT